MVPVISPCLIRNPRHGTNIAIRLALSQPTYPAFGSRNWLLEMIFYRWSARMLLTAAVIDRWVPLPWRVIKPRTVVSRTELLVIINPTSDSSWHTTVETVNFRVLFRSSAGRSATAIDRCTDRAEASEESGLILSFSIVRRTATFRFPGFSYLTTTLRNGFPNDDCYL